MNKESLAYDCYITNVNMAKCKQNCWLTSMHKIIRSCNMPDLPTENENVLMTENDNVLMEENMSTDTEPTTLQHNKGKVREFKTKLREIYDGQFETDLYNDNRKNGEGNKLRTFRMFKTKIEQENYLNVINDRNIRKSLCRLRISAHNLAIEKGRHRRPHKIPANERYCDICNEDKIGNEMHTIISCKTLEKCRDDLYRSILTENPDFKELDNAEKFIFIMKAKESKIINDLTVFMKEIIKARGNF